MNTLHVAADSWWLLRAAAAILLFAHIAGGATAMFAGATALATRKGGRLHGIAGNAFFVSMLVMTLIGGVVSLFLFTKHGDRKFFDSLAGFITFYLVATGWMTVKRKAGTVGHTELAAFLFAALLVAVAITLGIAAGRSPSGLLGGYGSPGYFGFGSIVALAAAFDAKVIYRGGITGTSRIGRHVWRMSLALFVALMSFFVGQQRVMPDFMRGSPLLFIPPLAVFPIMVFWLLKLRLTKLINKVQRSRRRRLKKEALEAPSLEQERELAPGPARAPLPLPTAI
jgi:hypothetical protein